MPYGWKLRKLAKERNMTERALVISAIERTDNLTEAGAVLDMTEGAIRAAVKRLKIPVGRKTVVKL